MSLDHALARGQAANVLNLLPFKQTLMGEAMVIRLFWTNLAYPPLKNSYCQTTLYYRFRKRSGVREG